MKMSKDIRNVTHLYDVAESAANEINFKSEYGVPDLSTLLRAAYIRGHVDALRNNTSQNNTTEQIVDLDDATWQALKEAIIKSIRFQEMYDAGGNIENAVSNIKDWLAKTYTSDSHAYRATLAMLENLDHWEHIANELSKIVVMSETNDYKLINNASIYAYNELRQLQSKVKLLRANAEDGWR
jgi:hypothetical protein